LSDIRCDFAASPLHSKQNYSIIRGRAEYQRCSKHLGERSTDELTSPRLLTGWMGCLPLNKNPILATGVKDFAFGCTLHTQRFRGELPPPPDGPSPAFYYFLSADTNQRHPRNFGRHCWIVCSGLNFVDTPDAVTGTAGLL